MNILETADKITKGDRREEYGTPKESFERISKLWSVVLDIPITPEQVAICMIELKVARALHGMDTDSLVDIAGYARCIQMLDEDNAESTEAS